MLARRSSGAARLVCGRRFFGSFWRWWKPRREGEPSAASGGRSEAEAQCARELKEAALAATPNDLCELRRRGAKRPERAGPGPLAPGPALLFGAVGRPGGPPHCPKRRRPPLERRGLPGRHRATAVEPTEACWRGGSRSPLGCAGGRRRFAGLGGPRAPQTRKTKAWAGPRAPPMLCARGARPPPPPGNAGIFLRPREPFANLFSPRKPTNKTSLPLPVSGGPAYAVGKPKKDSSQFSPAFLKAGQGVWGAGSPPHGVPGGRALQKAYYTLKRKSTTSPSCMT